MLVSNYLLHLAAFSQPTMSCRQDIVLRTQPDFGFMVFLVVPRLGTLGKILVQQIDMLPPNLQILDLRLVVWY